MLIDWLEELEDWLSNRFRSLKCRLLGHPAPDDTPGPWVQIWRLCPNCGAVQHIVRR